MSKAWGLSRLQSLYFSSEPESMPRSGEQCKHPGLSSEPAGPDCTKPPASPQPAHSPRVTQRPQQSCLCWPVIDDTQEFHSWPPCVFGLPWRPGENRVHWGYWVSQPWSRGKSLRGKKRRSNIGEVTVEVEQTAITVISEDKRWELSYWSFAGPVDAHCVLFHTGDLKCNISFSGSLFVCFFWCICSFAEFNRNHKVLR